MLLKVHKTKENPDNWNLIYLMKNLDLSAQGFAQVSLLPGSLLITYHALGQQCHLMDKQQFVLLGDLFMCRLHTFKRGEEEVGSYCWRVIDFPSSNTTLEKLLLFPLWQRAHRTCKSSSRKRFSHRRGCLSTENQQSCCRT